MRDRTGIKKANQLGKMIFDAIQALPTSLSSPVPNFDPVLRDEIEGIRYSDDGSEGLDRTSRRSR